jgi:hypothetical protein
VTVSMADQAPRKSKLIVVGLFLLAAALLLPQPLTRASHAAAEYGPRVVLAILSDVFRACFFVAIGCFAIGALRNRRWRKESTLQKVPK